MNRAFVRRLPVLALLGILSCQAQAEAEEVFLTLASTTSTRDSGLLAHLSSRFEARTGIETRTIAVGTGRALELGRRGDADVLLVHDRASEDEFVREGYGAFRRDVMYNDFVLVGPSTDPAGIRGLETVAAALARIYQRRAPFLSRGDDSGTHKAELRLWNRARKDPRPASGTWYRETGNGMGATLNTAVELGAYVLTDRGTWLSFRRREGLEVLIEGDPQLHNPYGVLVVNPERHSHVKFEAAERFADWLTSADGRGAIDDFRVHGEALFFSAPQATDVAHGQEPPGADATPRLP